MDFMDRFLPFVLFRTAARFVRVVPFRSFLPPVRAAVVFMN